MFTVAPTTTPVSTTATSPTYTTTTPSLTNLTPRQEDSNTNTLLVVIVATGVAVGILVVLVIVAVAILMMVTARRMKLVKRVDLMGHHSPMENPSYAIGIRLRVSFVYNALVKPIAVKLYIGLPM